LIFLLIKVKRLTNNKCITLFWSLDHSLRNKVFNHQIIDIVLIRKQLILEMVQLIKPWTKILNSLLSNSI
jgi:hypothetical protein